MSRPPKEAVPTDLEQRFLNCWMFFLRANVSSEISADYLPSWQYRMPETKRLFRWDWAFPKGKVVVDLQGGLTRGGFHNLSIARYFADCEKLNLAASLDYSVFHFTILHLERDPLGSCQMVYDTLTRRLAAKE